jgi:hypothetical protein
MHLLLSSMRSFGLTEFFFSIMQSSEKFFRFCSDPRKSCTIWLVLTIFFRACKILNVCSFILQFIKECTKLLSLRFDLSKFWNSRGSFRFDIKKLLRSKSCFASFSISFTLQLASKWLLVYDHLLNSIVILSLLLWYSFYSASTSTGTGTLCRKCQRY